MAKSSKNDVVQVIMMTLYLMAIFFGGWGMYLHFHKIENERADREIQAQRLTELQVLLKDRENKGALNDFRLKEKSRENAGNLEEDVVAVLNSMPVKLVPTEMRDEKPRDVGGGIVQHEVRLKFPPMSAKQGILHFVQAVEDQKPHISFDKVKFFKKGRDKTADVWSSELTLISYTGDD